MNNFHMQQSDYNFKEMTDEQVVVIAQQEQNEFAIDYIVNKYKNFVRAKARTYFLSRCRSRRHHSRRHDWSCIRLRGILDMIN